METFFEFECPYCGDLIKWSERYEKSFLCDNCDGACQVHQKDDGVYIISKEEEASNEEDGKWDILVHQIINGDIIPVIGEDLVLNGDVTVKQRLIKAMCQTDKIDINNLCSLASNSDHKPQINSYSQLIYHPDYKKDKENIYERITKLISKYEKQFKPSKTLKRLLSIKEFPFVITVTQDPVTENTMRKIWEKRNRSIKTLIFNNDPKRKDSKGDITKETDIEYPTIYYMFGKANTNLPHRFVATDEDMLSFCKSWLTEGMRPTILSRAIASKSLLFMGCNYPDWLVRFIWYSMRSDLLKSGMLVGENIESSLEDFMKRVYIETQRNPEHVIDEIERRLEQRREELNKTRFDEPRTRTDVFISYSRKDENAALKLYEVLTGIGLNVWYDRNRINGGDIWLEKIKRSIETTKFFIPLISTKMKEQVNESHVYRKEWNMAIEHSKGMGSRRGFIIPITLDDANLEDPSLDLPDTFILHNALTIKTENDFNDVATEILKRINDLTK